MQVSDHREERRLHSCADYCTGHAGPKFFLPSTIEARCGELAEQIARNAPLAVRATKEILDRHGVMPTFMAKPIGDMPGCSGHSHQSLWANGEPAFHDPSDPDGLSKTFRHYLAGLVKLLPDLMALLCPTINSFKRTARRRVNT